MNIYINKIRSGIKTQNTHAILSLFTSFFVICLFSFQAKAQHKTSRPNIIFILVDDQGYGDIGVFHQNMRAKEGKPAEKSPFLDKMAAQGAILTQQYAAAPVCAPSRASILLGVSQGHANVRDNQFDKALADNYTMSSTLKKLGYSTAAIGKWGLQGDKRWDKNGASWPAKPRNRGFDYFFGYMRHSDGHEHYPKEGKYRGKKEVWNNGKNIAAQLDKCYTADLWTAAAKHWIIQHKKGKESNKPFFMYLAFDTPHAVDELPTQQYPSGGGLTGGIQWIGKPGHFINTASGDIDSYINPDYAHATYDNDSNRSTPEIAWPDTYKRYATANRRIDFAVGDILKLLEDLHIDSNTLVIYTSDNGPSVETYLDKEKEAEKHLPTFFESYGPFDGIKRDNWEGGVRMPLIAWWPGHIAAGKIINTVSISYDWAPTFIQAAGEPAPERMDGISLLSTLTGKEQLQKRLTYIEYFQSGRTPNFKQFAPAHRGRLRDQMQHLRIGDYVGVRYDIKSAADDFEIYNVSNDPQEENNLALHPDKKISHEGDGAFFPIDIHSIEELQGYFKAHALEARRPDSAAPRPYDSTLIPAVNEKVVPGIVRKLYKGDFPWIPQTETLTETTKDRIPVLGVSPAHHITEGIVSFEGFISIPEDGEYTFYLNVDTKAFLRLHGMQLIDEDFGYKSGTEKKATVFLKAGLHPFKLCYKLQKNSKPSLELKWSGPHIEKQSITKNAFFSERDL